MSPARFHPKAPYRVSGEPASLSVVLRFDGSGRDQVLATLSLGVLCAALDAGQHGVPFATHGVGGLPVWEQYRRNSVTEGLSVPLMTLARDGGELTFEGVRQGCTDMDCATQTPGVFISRAPGMRSPPYSPVVFMAASPTPAFDVRLALIEAAADGGLRPFVQAGGGDLGERMDPYFPMQADGLSLHLSVELDPASARLSLQQATCMSAGSTLREELRVDRRNEFITPLTVAVARLARIEWGLVSGSPGLRDFVVFADGLEVMRWPISSARLLSCENADDAGFSDGTLDTALLVPVMYVGWGDFTDPLTQATLVMRFAGYAPRFIGVPAVATVGQPLSLERALFFEDGGVARESTSVVLRIEGPGVTTVETTQPGLMVTGTSTSPLTPLSPGVYRLSLEVAGPAVAVEHFIVVTAPDAGPAADAGMAVDAGTIVDAGTPVDAGTLGDAGAPGDAGVADAGSLVDGGTPGDAGVTDAGALADAGTALDAGTRFDAGSADSGTSLDAGPPDAGAVADAGTSPDAGSDALDRRRLTVGCGCWHAEVEAMWLGVVLLWVARRRRWN